MIFAVVKWEGVTYVREPTGRWGVLEDGQASMVSNNQRSEVKGGYYEDAAPAELASRFDSELLRLGHL